MRSLPAFSVAAPLSKHPSTPCYLLNLADRIVEATHLELTKEWWLCDLHGNRYLSLAGDYAALTAYITEHYISNGAFWTNPATLIFAEHNGDNLTLRSIASKSRDGKDLIRTNSAISPIDKLVAAGFTRIAPNAVVALDRVAVLDDAEGELILFTKPGLSDPVSFEPTDEILNQVTTAIAAAGWARRVDGAWVNPTIPDYCLELTPVDVTKADLKANRVFIGGIGKGRPRAPGLKLHG